MKQQQMGTFSMSKATISRRSLLSSVGFGIAGTALAQAHFLPAHATEAGKETTALWTSPLEHESTQSNWRWCHKCQGLFFAGNATPGICPALGVHDDQGSGNYVLTANVALASGQGNWRWCLKCQGLFFNGNATPGICPALGVHDASRSGNYLLVLNSSAAPGQSNWRWCLKCQGLFFNGNTTPGICPALGVHDASRSGNYTLVQG